MTLAYLGGHGVTVIGQGMGWPAKQQMANARQTHQLSAFFNGGDGTCGQPQQGFYLPDRGRAPGAKSHRAVPARNLNFVGAFGLCSVRACYWLRCAGGNPCKGALFRA